MLANNYFADTVPITKKPTLQSLSRRKKTVEKENRAIKENARLR